MSRDYDWTIIPGDDEERVFEYNDANGVSIDLTGYEVHAYAFVFATDETTELVADINTPATDGKVTVLISDVETAAIAEAFGPFGAYFVIRLTSPGGTKRTLAHGNFLLDGPV